MGKPLTLAEKWVQWSTASKILAEEITKKMEKEKIESRDKKEE